MDARPVHAEITVKNNPPIITNQQIVLHNSPIDLIVGIEKW